jgi:hypothetical protein
VPNEKLKGLQDEYGRQLQINPICVLDFYIHESVQREGMIYMVCRQMHLF